VLLVPPTVLNVLMKVIVLNVKLTSFFLLKVVSVLTVPITMVSSRMLKENAKTVLPDATSVKMIESVLLAAPNSSSMMIYVLPVITLVPHAPTLLPVKLASLVFYPL